MNNLLRLVYASSSTNPIRRAGVVQTDVGRILMQARKNNPANRIGGVLYFSNNYYFQCLEGEQQAVNQLYKKIIADPRHENVQSLSVKRIQRRQFANWSMKYVTLEHKVSHLLEQNNFDSFDPYAFDEAMIDKMLGLFTTLGDVTAEADQHYEETDGKKQRSGFLSRLFSRRNAA